MKQRKTNVALVTAAIFIGTFMTAIEGTIVSTAMPTNYRQFTWGSFNELGLFHFSVD